MSRAPRRRHHVAASALTRGMFFYGRHLAVSHFGRILRRYFSWYGNIGVAVCVRLKRVSVREVQRRRHRK